MPRKPRARFVVDPAVRQAIEWRSRWTLRLLKQYSGRWIAIRGRQVVAAARTYAELQDRLDVLRPGAVYVSREETPVLVVY